jgi:hypothetical protein
MAPDPPQITPTDPRLEAERAAADAANIKALSVQAEGDTASLMARYGTRLALAGVAGGSPLMAASAAQSIGRAA